MGHSLTRIIDGIKQQRMALGAVRCELDRLEKAVLGIWLMARLALIRQIDKFAFLVEQSFHRLVLFFAVSCVQMSGVVETDASSVLPV